MKSKATVAYAAIFCAVTVAVGYWHGQQTNRWGHGVNLRQMASNLDRLPKTLGDWEMSSSQSMLPLHQQELQCAGYSLRQYVENKTGRRMQIGVLLGPAGPISLHDPNVCYPMQGYAVVQEPSRATFKVGDNEIVLWSTVMRSPEFGGDAIRVVWAWNDGSGWESPNNSRFHYAGREYLYKIQIVETAVDFDADTEAMERFLSVFLPAVESCMSEAAPSNES